MKNIWKRFFSLTEGQDFYIRRNKLAVKVGFCSYQEHAGEAETIEQWGKHTPERRIAPWRRVRTTQPIKAGNYPIKVAATQTARITASDCYNPDYATGRELAASEIQDRENLDRILAQANAQPCECEIYQTCARCSPFDAELRRVREGAPLREERDPMAQDHSPDKPSVAPTDRNGPSS